MSKRIATITKVPALRRRISPWRLIVAAALISQPQSWADKSPAIDTTHAEPRPSIVGWWFFEIPTMGLSLLLKVSQDKNGAYTATHDNLVVTEERDQKVTPFWCDARSLRIELDQSTSGVMQLSLNKKGDQLEGFYKSTDVEIPIAYKRVKETDFPPEPPLNYQSPPEGKPDLRGFWRGILNRDGVQFNYAIKVGKTPDGRLQGSVDLFEAGRRNQRLTEVLITNGVIRLGNRDLNFRFEGEFSPDGQNMKGKLSDWTDTGDVVFTRLKAPAKFPSLQPRDKAGRRTEIDGTWEAQIDRQRSDARAQIQIGYAVDGSHLALFGNPEKTQPDLFPTTDFGMTNDTIRLDWKGRGVAFHGTRLEDALHGTWLEGKSKTPVVFRRVKSGEQK